MCKTLLLILAGIIGLYATEDSWEKVRDLKSGTELRIYKKGGKQPVLAKMDQATEESLIVVLKNEQVSIAKEDIERLDQRPAGGSRVTKQTTTKTNTPPNPSADRQRIGGRPATPSSASSTSFSIGSKPDFETIYLRLPPAAKK